MRKYGVDFWSFMYTRRRKNNFFINFRLSLVVKLVQYYYRGYFSTNLKSKKIFNNLTMKLNSNHSQLGLYFFKKPIKVRQLFKKKIGIIRKFFLNYKHKLKGLNYKFGERASFKLFKTKKIKSPYSRLRLFVKRFCCFTTISPKKF